MIVKQNFLKARVTPNPHSHIFSLFPFKAIFFISAFPPFPISCTIGLAQILLHLQLLHFQRNTLEMRRTKENRSGKVFAAFIVFHRTAKLLKAYWFSMNFIFNFPRTLSGRGLCKCFPVKSSHFSFLFCCTYKGGIMVKVCLDGIRRRLEKESQHSQAHRRHFSHSTRKTHLDILSGKQSRKPHCHRCTQTLAREGNLDDFQNRSPGYNYLKTLIL